MSSLKLGFALEGNSDYPVIPILARRVVAEQFPAIELAPDSTRHPRKHGHGFITELPIFAKQLYDDGAAVIVAVVDTDNTRIGERRSLLRDAQAKCRSNRIPVCMAEGLAVHSLEAWLLADEQAIAAVFDGDLAQVQFPNPEADLTPKATLNQIVRALTDGRDTPDTQWATFEYGKQTLILESCLWTPYMKKVPMELRDRDQFANWPFEGTRIELCGTKGFMYLGRHGGGWQVIMGDQKPIASKFGRQGDKWHIENFLECVRTRNRPNSDVAQGHASTMLCHLANASYRAGNKKLVFDAQTETFPGSPEANAFLKRTYRTPWAVPETV